MEKLDLALLGWILSSISPDVQFQITKHAPTFQLWTSLLKLLGNQSKAKMMQLKFQLQSTQKGVTDNECLFSKK